MKTRIDQLLKGEFEYELPELVFSQEKVSVSVKAGGTFRGEVFLGAEDGRKIRGYITSSDRRLVPGLLRFSGTAIRLPFGVDAVGMKPGEVRNAWLCFTTSIGEARLPFVIETPEEKASASTGEIRDLSAFARLASEDFREACRVFQSPGFSFVMKEASPEQRSVYAGLSVPPVTNQNVEEFLIAMGLKEKVTVTLADLRREVMDIRESSADSLRIQRSGWGHLRLEAEAEGDFIELEKRVITDEDFIGSTYHLEYVIRQEKIGRGTHYGCIRIRSPYQTLTFEIAASRGAKTGTDIRKVEKERRLTLCRDFLDHLLGNMDSSAWAVSSHYELKRLLEAGYEYPEYLLLEAFIYLKEGRNEEAVRILTSFRDKSYSKNDLETAGSYLYLCVKAGLYKDREGALRRLRSFFMQKEDSFPLLRILLDMDPEYASPKRALLALEDQFDRGVRTPFMYLEGLKRIRENESLLIRLTPYWVQVYLFAAKNRQLSAELQMRFAYLSGYEKKFNLSLYRALSMGYEAFPTEDSLEAVCRFIMHDDPRKKEYFVWYRRALEKGLRLTRLYEYYMETMDTSAPQPLPKSLLMYFNYNNNSLGESRKAYIYANVTQRKEQEPEIYAEYLPIMKEFAREKLREGKISEDLAVLYRSFAGSPEDREEAEDLGRVVFCRRLYCDDPNVREVIVKHSQLKEEEIWPLPRETAFPQIYTKDAAVIFQDAKKRRYCVTVEHSRKDLLEISRLVPEILSQGCESPGLLLSYCESHEITGDNLLWFQKVCLSDAFTEEYQDSIRRRILRFYQKDVRGKALEEQLKRLDLKEYARVDRECLLQVLSSRGMFREMFEVTEEFGTEDVESSALLRMISRMILRSDEEEDEELLNLASEIYRKGVYDELILSYLMKYRYGPMDELLGILKSARGFDMDVYDFEERILSLLMLTQDYRKEGEQILQHYASESGKERVIGAYLTQAAYGWFIKDYNISSFIRKSLERAYRAHWPIGRICHFALFKAIVREKDEDGRYNELKKTLLKECCDLGYAFAFFRRLPPAMLSPYQLDDKTFVECHADPEAKVILHYSLDTGLGAEAVYRTRPVRMMYEGIFEELFTLFYGETLRYWFEVEEHGEVRRTNERSVTMNRTEGTPASKYQMLNQILAERKLGREKESAARLKKYLRQEQYVEEMFVPDRG